METSNLDLNIRGERFPARLPTKDESVEAWSRLAFDLNFHRSVSLYSREVEVLLRGIDRWVQSQKQVIGESEAAFNDRVGQAFWDNIARTSVPRSTRGRPRKNVEE